MYRNSKGLRWNSATEIADRTLQLASNSAVDRNLLTADEGETLTGGAVIDVQILQTELSCSVEDSMLCHRFAEIMKYTSILRTPLESLMSYV
ncbi:hypothetical protein HO173_011701 [Letharia columbiana]|uniref:Uncharacterized protein n=1 Tax=Letharia columbiana TaxID=112416 RepID=A0A8H6FHE8_9LECA|nr:uncharacterized protein HO173_011701 [Letharia columbiana]KAF6228682.1 hypothetical protein HO173_011701 [Letharia columbiana]